MKCPLLLELPRKKTAQPVEVEAQLRCDEAMSPVLGLESHRPILPLASIAEPFEPQPRALDEYRFRDRASLDEYSRNTVKMVRKAKTAIPAERC